MLIGIVLSAFGLALVLIEFTGHQSVSLGTINKLHRRVSWKSAPSYLGGAVLAVAVWQIGASIAGKSTTFLPTPGETVVAALRLVKSGVLIREASISVARVFIGFG